MNYREVKFRGKRLDNGEWAYGSLVEISRTGETSIVDWDDVSYTRREVDPETVGQYIRLNDKLGVEIYEGDIIRSDQIESGPNTREVAFDDVGIDGKTRSFTGYNQRAYFFPFGDSPKALNAKDCVVIGNRYDNPELRF